MTVDALKAAHAFVSERPGSKDCLAVNVPAAELVTFMQWLRDVAGYTLLVDVTAMDHGETVNPRFTGLYHLYNTETFMYLRVAADCTGSVDEPELPSLSGVFPAANWHERETYDMLGVRYTGHPDLRRILMWDEYPYFPLRKEFPLAGWDAEMPDADVVAATEGDINPTAAPMMGGPFVSPQDGPMSRREPAAKDESWTEKKQK